MKKIIPFKKDIEFNTSIFEINSISLEHNVKSVDDNSINGEFIISGDYKESDNVINNEPFIFNIPFNIDLDNKYDFNKSSVEIDNFNYNLIDSNRLEVNINLLLDNIDVIEDDTPMIDILDIEEKEDVLDKAYDEIKEVRHEDIKDNFEENISIFNNFDEKDDKYICYHVHIFRENDSIENIIKLYNTSKDELEEYNDLSSISIGSKLIVPSNE